MTDTELKNLKDNLWHSVLINDLEQIIDSARQRVAVTVNAELTMMYWHIGERINREILGNQRAEYGKQIVSTVATQLQELYGTKGFEPRTIRRMMQFASLFPDIQIVTPLVTQLSWSHFLAVMPLKDEIQREFYLTMAASEHWSKRMLQSKIDSMLFERTAIAQKPDELIKQELAELRDDNKMSPDLVFKSPYFLEFTGLKGCYSEKSLEDSLVVHLEQFILELGNGFTFVERQKRMIIDGEDFYLDLLFFHRKLHRLIAIDLLCCAQHNRSQITHQDVGQMDMYVRMYDELKRTEGDNPTFGLILCSKTSADMARYSILKENKQLFQAKYLTYLPTEEELRQEIERQKEIFLEQQKGKDINNLFVEE